MKTCPKCKHPHNHAHATACRICGTLFPVGYVDVIPKGKGTDNG